MGKPDESYFKTIPKNWSLACEDHDLGLSYYPELAKINLHQTVEIDISLSTPPHRIDGNDIVHVRWNTTQCIDCFTLSPQEFTFNIKNFQQKQKFKVTRIKDAPRTTLIPILYGGGFDAIPPQRFPIHIE